jgi:hypothetical protein
MNWKTEAIEKLRRYDAMRQAAMNMPDEIARLEDEACSLRGLGTDNTPVKGGGSHREDGLLSNMVCRQELEAALRQAKAWLRITDRALAALTPEEKLVLHRFYIYPERGSVDRLCGELRLEQSSIYSKRDKALYKFTVALYGAADS